MLFSLIHSIGSANVVGGVIDALIAASATPLQYDLQFYIDSLFSGYHEVHSFQMGIYAGIVVLVLTARGYTRLATAAILAAFAFALGLPPSDLLCDPAASACGGAQVQTKPWYFMTGVLVLGLLGPRLLEIAAALAGRLTERLPVATLHDNPSESLSTQAGPYAHVRALLRWPIPSLANSTTRDAAESDDRARTDGGRSTPPSAEGNTGGGSREPYPEFDPPTNRDADGRE